MQQPLAAGACTQPALTSSPWSRSCARQIRTDRPQLGAIRLCHYAFPANSPLSAYVLFTTLCSSSAAYIRLYLLPAWQLPQAALPRPMRLYKFPGAETAPSSPSAAYAAVQIPRRKAAPSSPSAAYAAVQIPRCIGRPKQPFRRLCGCINFRVQGRPKQPFRRLCGCINFRGAAAVPSSSSAAYAPV